MTRSQLFELLGFTQLPLMWAKVAEYKSGFCFVSNADGEVWYVA